MRYPLSSARVVGMPRCRGKNDMYTNTGFIQKIATIFQGPNY